VFGLDTDLDVKVTILALPVLLKLFEPILDQFFDNLERVAAVIQSLATASINNKGEHSLLVVVFYGISQNENPSVYQME
jgi:hypothetical protein